MDAKFLPRARLTLTPNTMVEQTRLLQTWLAPLADTHLTQIKTADLTERILRPMVEAGRSPNSQYLVHGFRGLGIGG
jgi:hypothetical protein